MAAKQGFSLGAIAVPVYFPGLVFSLGQNAYTPVLPAIAILLGADLAQAGLVSAISMVGTLIGDLPAGVAVQRFGERLSMIGAANLATMGVTLALLAPNVFLLAAGVLIMGFATSVFFLARQSFMSLAVPRSHRARAMSMMGGVFRAGSATGPFIGAAIIGITGEVQSVFLVTIAANLVTLAFVWFVPDLEIPTVTGELELTKAERSVLRTFHQHRHMMLTIGLGSAILSAIRTSRNVIMPLWAVTLDVSPATTSFIIGLSAVLELALFAMGGWMMDRYGRVRVVVPVTGGLTLVHAAIFFVDDLPQHLLWLSVISLGMALANGLGSGILMTLAADAAPRRSPARFLAAFNLLKSAGQAAAPVWIAGFTAWLSVGAAALVTAGIGVIGTALLWVYIPKLLPEVARGNSMAPTTPIPVIVPKVQAEFEPKSGLTATTESD